MAPTLSHMLTLSVNGFFVMALKWSWEDFCEIYEHIKHILSRKDDTPSGTGAVCSKHVSSDLEQKFWQVVIRSFLGSDEGNDGMNLPRIAQWEHSWDGYWTKWTCLSSRKTLDLSCRLNVHLVSSWKVKRKAVFHPFSMYYYATVLK